MGTDMGTVGTTGRTATGAGTGAARRDLLMRRPLPADPTLTLRLIRTGAMGTDMGWAATTGRTATGAATGAARSGRLMRRPPLADPTLKPRPTPGTDTDTDTVTGPTAGVDTTDLMAMATGDARSGPLTRRSPPAVPTLTPRLTHTGGATGEGMAMVDTTGHTATGE